MHGVRRVFHDGNLDGVVELDEATSHKLKNVLRAESGDSLEVLSKEYLGHGKISVVGKRNVQVRIDEKRAIIKPDYSLTVYQGILKREYMDFVVEKYTELGVTEIIPIISSRSLKELKNNTHERLNQIAIEAALQSERETIPTISKPVDISKIKPCHSQNILFHERLGAEKIPNIDKKDVGIVIGAEGGFTEAETNSLVEKGFVACHPISSILKAETAAVLFAGVVRMGIR